MSIFLADRVILSLMYYRNDSSSNIFVTHLSGDLTSLEICDK